MSTLSNKIGLVTGSGQGIGRAIALSFAREGAKVVVADFNEEMGQQTVELITNAGGSASFIYGDMSKEDSVKTTVDFVISTYGRLDIACNSAAVSRGSGPIHKYEHSTFDQTLEMCLTNTWLCMKHEIAAMLENGGGAIVNISSNASLRGQAFNTASAISSGAPRRFITDFFLSPSSLSGCSSKYFSRPGVRTTPGDTALIRMPLAPYSAAALFVRILTAPLAAA